MNPCLASLAPLFCYQLNATCELPQGAPIHATADSSGDAGDPRRLRLARGRPRTTPSASPACPTSPTVADLPARLPAHLRPRRRPAGRPDGQLRGRPHEHRRRPRRATRNWRASATPSPDGSLAKRRAARTTSSTNCSQSERHLPPARAWSLPVACIRTRTTPPRWRNILHDAGVPTVLHAFTDGRDTPPRSGGDDDGAPARGAAKGRADRHRHRPLFRHGPRQALGPRRQGLRRARRATAPLAPTPVQAIATPMQHGQDRRIHPARRDRRL